MAGGQPGTREACAGGPWQWGLCSGLAQKLHLPHSTTWLKALMGRVLSPSPFQIRLRKFWVCLCCINPGGYQSWAATSDHLYFSTCTAIDPSSYKQYIRPCSYNQYTWPASADTHFGPPDPAAHSLCRCWWKRALLQAAGTQPQHVCHAQQQWNNSNAVALKRS